MSVAVITGAAGFLGRAFRAALHDRGWEVRGIDVRPGPGVTQGDVTRPGSWAGVLDGADLVVHAALIGPESGDAATAWRVNVDGTRALVDVAGSAGVGRLVHVSSTVVHGRDFPDGVDESGAVRMTGNPYTDTTVAAEHQVLLAAAAGRVAATIVRAGDVYGPHSEQWTLRPVQLMRRGLFVLVDGGHGVLSPTYVDDLVDGALAAATSPHGDGQVFHVTGGEPVEARDFFGRYAAMLGIRLRSLPASAATVLAAPVGIVSRAMGLQPPLSPRSVEYVTHPGSYSIAKAAQLLGWTPGVLLDEGMDRTEQWLREAGLLGPLVDEEDRGVEVEVEEDEELPDGG